MGQILGEPYQGIEVVLGWGIDQVHVIEGALAKRFVNGQRASWHVQSPIPWFTASGVGKVQFLFIVKPSTA
ncbi:hypothetical protein [Pseudomonas sp. HMSC08G10]|uniref:hypothetical protein n=1 Tax=Pseudomonas TaxID=286 RepID=UPI0021148429|nr:hypothetical protein [Pseudomonas sp. HMSC08G10]